MTRKQKITSVILTLVFLALMLTGAAYVTRDKFGDSKAKAFYDNPEDFDVYIFGSSHATMGLLPLEMWESEGITAYNFSNYGQAIPVDYWLLRNAVAQHKPQVVVVDVYTIFFTEKYSHVHMGMLHQSLDPVPLSRIRFEMLEDLLDDGENHLEMYLPFSFHHSRWDQLTDRDFDIIRPGVQLGGDINQSASSDFNGISDDASNRLLFPFDGYNLLPVTEVNDEETICREYIRKIIEFCQSEGISVVLTTCPQYLTEDQQRWINSVYSMAEAYNVPFVNGVQTNVVNYRTDMFDSGHLNSSGARKWSNYMAQYLIQTFGLTSHRGDSHYSYLDSYYSEYLDLEMSQITQNYSLYGCLMLASNPNYTVTVAVRDNSAIYEDNNVRYLLNNINGIIVTDEMWEERGEVCLSSDISLQPFTIVDADISIAFYAPNGELFAVTEFVADENGLDGFTRTF